MRLHRLVIALVTSTSLFAASAKNSPMLSVLPQFTAANVPALGPGEQPADQTWDAPTEAPPNRPGHDIAEHPMLYAGEGYNNLLLVSGGKVIWNYFTGPHGELDDAWLMSMAASSTHASMRSRRSHLRSRSSGITTRPLYRDPHLPAHRPRQSSLHPERPAAEADGHRQAH